ncbi:unnamed protein product [Caenorhabditis sp. 36 PRJEB53466]|nr:unnamed protein product [Caenorhabditis sp. 36 PRJEB53466]
MSSAIAKLDAAMRMMDEAHEQLKQQLAARSTGKDATATAPSPQKTVIKGLYKLMSFDESEEEEELKSIDWSERTEHSSVDVSFWKEEIVENGGMPRTSTPINGFSTPALDFTFTDSASKKKCADDRVPSFIQI